MATVRRSILLKSRLGTAGLTLALGSVGLAGQVVSARPLFKHIGLRRKGDLDVSQSSPWQIVDFDADSVDANLWDVCHSLFTETSALAGGGVDFAEPNLAQHWRYDSDAGYATSLTSGCVSAPPRDGLPTEDNILWYRDEDHANFVSAKRTGTGVRIAHLDTGYDPNHTTLPKNMDFDRQWDFLENARDARDRPPGPGLTNFGHGAGTLGILAGAPSPATEPHALGGAPDATIVPLRVADGVVLFYNSTIAEAFDYVFGLCESQETFIDVISMSMGGLASRAWADAVNALYERGVLIVTAAGNNFANWPTRNIVYPARFRRVVAACGVMANGLPYADLSPTTMAGNYGPQSKMDDSAIAAYTPNIPWARFGCPQIVNRDGAGTSSATPQVAAAAALWIEEHRAALQNYAGWTRVEAIRAALFGGARATDSDRIHFGRGLLDVEKALEIPPVAVSSLQAEPLDDVSFPIFQLLSGLGIHQISSTGRAMLELEALQLSQSLEVERVLQDVKAVQLDQSSLRRAAEIMASSPRASRALRQALAPIASAGVSYSIAPSSGETADLSPPLSELAPDSALEPRVSKPPYRPLRVYAFDPTLELELRTLAFNEAVLQVRWEELEPGPTGEYLQIIDVDHPSAACYAPIDLSNQHLLVQNGRSPAEAVPQFHQQMTYAVAMKTIEYFELALGRTALWAPHREIGKPNEFVQRLRIYPHALREPNAYYSSTRKALLFGYFFAAKDVSKVQAPGTLVFTCLSHDVIAHETTHALLDGLHRRYMEPSNPDVLAFHEGFADIVALFQHFALTEALRSQIEANGGDLRRDNLMAGIAKQFGEATYGRAALRDYIGTTPTRSDYENASDAHERGAVLVAAVFDAFLRIYRMSADRIIELATLGSGVLPAGQLPAVLTERLAQKAAQLASQWLNICIRALDYCPPVDITFGDYLRALITADRDLVPNDKLGYRTAFATAFRDRGIFAEGVRSVSPSTLVWEKPQMQLADLPRFLATLDFSWDLRANRRKAFGHERENCRLFKNWLVSSRVTDAELNSLGVWRDGNTNLSIGGEPGVRNPPEVHSIRPARRVGPNKQMISDVVVEITQSWYPRDRSPWNPPLRGGVTLLVDLASGRIRYAIRKRAAQASQSGNQRAFALAFASQTLHGNYGLPFGDGEGHLALVHRAAMTYRPRASSNGR